MARRVTSQEGEVVEDLQRDVVQCCVVEQLITIWYAEGLVAIWGCFNNIDTTSSFLLYGYSWTT